MSRSNRLYGSVELLVLRTLDRHGPLHGLDIARRIADGSDEAIQIEEGALYPALHRMEKRGWLASRWGVSEKGRRARYYALTREGHAALRDEETRWARYVTAVGRLAPEGGSGA